MLVLIEDIKVKKRLRKDMGDLTGLAESMKRFGQLCPILITKNNVLIAGGRRLEAARSLGWRTINALIPEIPQDMSLLEFEAEENLQRQNFNSQEVMDAAWKINRLQNPNFFRRLWRALARFIKKLLKINGP